MDIVTLIDFGSTFTKATVISLQDQEIIYTFRTPSTVQTDASIGLQICLDAIEKKIGKTELKASYKLASSSAAGGLRMIVVGLTESLSMMAGKNAAYGAGAKVIKAFYHQLTEENLAEICTIRPEIILLCGGYEGGNSSWVLENARRLAACAGVDAPVVYAGNSVLQADIRLLFTQHQKTCIVSDNIIPAIQELDIRSSVEAVRNIFMKRITHMKGFDTVKAYVGDIVMPTPAAVLEGVKLLALGTERYRGWEQIMLIDMGGATTDIHTYAPTDTMEGVHLIGAPEPAAKRTVEGDIGMRESVGSLVGTVDDCRLSCLAEMGKEAIHSCVTERLANHSFLAQTLSERKFEEAAAREGVRVSIRRHVGRLYDGYAGAAQKVQKGKDLRGVKAIIGTGGPIIDSMHPERILQEALKKEDETNLLLPEQALFYLDRSYIFYAAGLLAQLDRNGAFQILTHSLRKLEDG